MTTEITKNGTEIIAALKGRLDTPSAVQCENDLNQLKEAEVQSAVIDCTDLSYISSSGLRIFISLHKHFLHNGGTLTIKGLSADIKEVFDMTGFTNIFNII